MNDLFSNVKIKLGGMSTTKFQMFDQTEGDVVTCSVAVIGLSGIGLGLTVRIRQPLDNITYLKQTCRVRGRPV